MPLVTFDCFPPCFHFRLISLKLRLQVWLSEGRRNYLLFFFFLLLLCSCSFITFIHWKNGVRHLCSSFLISSFLSSCLNQSLIQQSLCSEAHLYGRHVMYAQDHLFIALTQWMSFAYGCMCVFGWRIFYGQSYTDLFHILRFSSYNALFKHHKNWHSQSKKLLYQIFFYSCAFNITRTLLCRKDNKLSTALRHVLLDVVVNSRGLPPLFHIMDHQVVQGMIVGTTTISSTYYFISIATSIIYYYYYSATFIEFSK